MKYMMQHRFSRICLRAVAAATALAAVIFALPAAHSFGATERANGAEPSAAQHFAPLSPTFEVVHSFGGSDGATPDAPLLRDSSGNLYGATFSGGNTCGFPAGCGTVFEVDSTGAFSVLYAFSGGLDGAEPYSNLIEDGAGNLYGTAFQGGTGDGVVFQLDSSGKETAIERFNGANGDYPMGGVIMDSSGNLYGTTQGGGSYGFGTVYKLVPQSGGGWLEAVLYSFQDSSDGGFPEAALVQDAVGNLYDTATSGGSKGLGVVFQVDAGGAYSVLYSFGTNADDGQGPESGLILDAGGNLYGTTFYGGGQGSCPHLAQLGCGVVFKLDTAGDYTALYRFTGKTDGAYPAASLMLGPSGSLYGTTTSGGLAGCGAKKLGCGVIFRLNTAGNETVLFTSTDGPGGADPYAGLITDGAGHAYGTASAGGDTGDGTVFRITF